MTIVTQYNRYACVPACLESIKKDAGDAGFSHKDFVNDNLDLFNGGTDTEGSCNLKDIPKICDLIDLDCGFFDISKPIDLSKSDFIFFVFWGDLERDKHCVRLKGFSSNGLVVMNPNNPQEFDTIPHHWVKAAFQINKREQDGADQPAAAV